MKKLLSISLFYFCLFTFGLHAQWVQQTLPVSGLVYDIAFFDANTGLVSMDTPALLRTTNGGANWVVINNMRIYNLKKIDADAIYANGRFSGVDKIYRSYDKGITWDSVSMSGGAAAIKDIFFVNRDTGWVSGFNGVLNTIYKTTNGGIMLTAQTTATGFGNIFFLKNRVNNEYCGWHTNSNMHYTTNSGVNWTQYTNIPNNNAGSIFFLNKDTGWVSNSAGSNPYVMYTTNNGVNWNIQDLPDDLGSVDIFFYNYLTGYGGGGFQKVVKTTNAGLNWGYQLTPLFTVTSIYFVDSSMGWCGGNGIAKTTNGGGNITYIGINQISSEIPKDYILYQNYPNPFNPVTNIKYQISKNSFVKLVVYDVLGSEITTLVNENQKPGTYLIDWDASNHASGMYFYKLIAENYNETRKMILLK